MRRKVKTQTIAVWMMLVSLATVPWWVGCGQGIDTSVSESFSHRTDERREGARSQSLADHQGPNSRDVTGATVPTTLESPDQSSLDVATDTRPDTESGSESEPDQGKGPGQRGDQYDLIVENPFMSTKIAPLSTFSVDVDTASYSKVRQYLMEYAQLPRPDAVRIEELVNYFDYQYSGPDKKEVPFAIHSDVGPCLWTPSHRLVRIALQGYDVPRDKRPHSNLVFLIDTSGSMKRQNKLPLLKTSMQLLLKQLNANDRVAIVTYAGTAGVALGSTPANQRIAIDRAISSLRAGGSTNGGDGLRLAYQIARENFITDGTNRILLCTDGDFNVGITSVDETVRLVESESKSGIDLTVLGFGIGNFNDSLLEQLTGRGNGNYAFIDHINEAVKVLSQQLSGTLVTIARDVKIQVEFNPNRVAAYRLIGYENRALKDHEFNDDAIDAGDIGAGHRVTALYEIVSVDAFKADSSRAAVDPLRYQHERSLSEAADSNEIMTVKLRYKLPGESQSHLMQSFVVDDSTTLDRMDDDFRFAAAVAGFGMLLRGSAFAGNLTFDQLVEIADHARGPDPDGLRQEFIQLVGIARSLQP